VGNKSSGGPNNCSHARFSRSERGPNSQDPQWCRTDSGPQQTVAPFVLAHSSSGTLTGKINGVQPLQAFGTAPSWRLGGCICRHAAPVKLKTCEEQQRLISNSERASTVRQYTPGRGVLAAAPSNERCGATLIRRAVHAKRTSGSDPHPSLELSIHTDLQQLRLGCAVAGSLQSTSALSHPRRSFAEIVDNNPSPAAASSLLSVPAPPFHCSN
jgi:hypothetical protein